MSERWVDVEEFPDYEISDHGNIFSKRNNQPLVPSWNGTSAMKINFSKEGVVHTRSVRVLVAEAFVDVEQGVIVNDPHEDIHETRRVYQRKINNRSTDLEVINIDGDQTNNHYENLAWRPHWFAWKYTRQFHEPPPSEYSVFLLNTQTGVVYDSVMDAGIANGLIWEYVYGSAITGRPVYPTGAVYEFVSLGTVSQLKQGL